MTKSTHSVRAKRINTALGLIQKHSQLSEAAADMVRHYGLSKRQAYRYLEMAKQLTEPIVVPDQKDRVYRQAFNRLDSAAAPTCQTNRLNPQRTCQSGFESLYSTRPRPWLNRHWIETFNWTIALIAYWQPNWRAFMKYWYPIRPGLSVSNPQIAKRRI